VALHLKCFIVFFAFIRNRTWRNEQVFTIAPMEKCIIGVLHKNNHLNLGSFVKNMSCNANVIIIDGKNKQKRSRNSSKTGLTPPTKITTSTPQDTSQVLAQARESLYNNHIALSASPVLPQHPPNTVPIISGQNYSTLPPYPTQSTPVLNTVCQ